MIEIMHPHKNIDYTGILDLVKTMRDSDFYFTENNERFYVTDFSTLKRFLRACRFIYVKKEKGEYRGLVMLWKSTGGGKDRYYLKMCALTPNDARDLMTVLLWNVSKEIFVKIRKENKILPVIRSKGFRFLGGRGIQVLLSKQPNKEMFTRKIYYDESRDEY